MSSSKDVFQTKFEEFARDLGASCPELLRPIVASLKQTHEERKTNFRTQVLPFCSPLRDAKECPEFVLPGVAMTNEIWSTLSEKSQTAIQEYLTVLSFCLLMDSNSSSDLSGNGWTQDMAKKMMEDMKEKVKGVDFASLSEKFAKFFGSAANGTNIPNIPEKFLKGQIARLAEEIVKEFKIEDFGIDPKTMEAAGNDPTKALNIIMEVFMKNPGAFQKTMLKLTKKLQQKVQSGALRPQELVAEAEELMKTFSENPQFVEMMEGFRQAFGMAGHEDELRASGNNGSARLSIARERLRRTYEARKAAKENGSNAKGR
jgi:hypothetical protein